MHKRNVPILLLIIGFLLTSCAPSSDSASSNRGVSPNYESVGVRTSNMPSETKIKEICDDMQAYWEYCQFSDGKSSEQCADEANSKAMRIYSLSVEELRYVLERC